MKTRSLGELAALKKALQTALREAAAQELREREQAAREAAERNLFTIAVGTVQIGRAHV